MKAPYISIIATWMLFCTLAASGQGELPLLSGELKSEITARDVSRIVTLVTQDKREPWLLHVTETKQVRPSNWWVRAYLTPVVANERLRRGDVLICSKQRKSVEIKDSQNSDWKVMSKHTYAQVPLDRKFGSSFATPSFLELPFFVEGDISDEDIIAVVDFIRGEPSTENVAAHMTTSQMGTVAKENRIIEIKKNQNVLEITTELDGNGQDLIVEKKGDKWILKSCGSWHA